jgi:hypothetical protein
LILLTLFLSTGCGRDKNVDTNIDEGAVGGSISVHVSDGNPASRPIYTWSDGSTDTTANMATRVTVARVDDLNTLVWGVSSPTVQDNIQSPVTHGTVPVNATPLDTGGNEELDLQTDVWYRVTISKVPPGPAGYREFLIKP